MMPLNMCCVIRRFLARKRISYSFFRHLASDNNSSNEWDESNKEKLDLSQYNAENIRNFCIIAHVDHGKSTLADRILEMTGTISTNSKNEQVLDRLQVERERGITVKAQNVCIFHKHYLLNLIDTPGHVDFNYEVSRSLAACQGAILLVDANQGVQAQTMANFFLAFESNLAIIPVLNKIDLKNAKPEAVAAQMAEMLEFDPNNILKISAKFGTGVDKLLDAVIEKVPPPTGDPGKPLKALVFDSWFDRYKGAVMNVAVNEGSISVGDKITSFHTKKSYTVKHIGVLRPDTTPVDKLFAGQVGYVIANMRSTSEAQVGDTLHHFEIPVTPLPGFKAAKPMVYAGIFPTDQSQTSSLRSAIDKLTLNDSSVSVQLETSAALGQGWRLGFLGLLHMDVFNQRLEQEHDAQVVLTAPSVPYKVKIKGEKSIKLYKTDVITINNPVHLPDPNAVENYFEPWVISTIITPECYMGDILGLCMGRRGKQLDSRNLDQSHLMLKFKLPLNEIVVDFYDILKSISSGYASFDYEESGYEPSDLVKVTYLLNGNPVEELTSVVHASRARTFGHHVCKRLKDTLPKHLFDIAIQATVGGKIIARETIKAAKKNVTAKCYGGDITRKMKLLKRQAEGKKQMRMVGNIEVPRDAFIKVLKQETS